MRKKKPTTVGLKTTAPQNEPLTTEIEDSFARLNTPRTGLFEVAPKHIVRKVYDALNARKRAARKRLIKPENAGELCGEVFKLRPSDRLHAITPGNFVFCELVIQLCTEASPKTLTLATLSLSMGNVDALKTAIDDGRIGSLNFLISDYFANVNKPIMAHMEQSAIGRKWRIGRARNHAKIALFDCGLVIETSANLRSSDNIEQITAMHDGELYCFHREWISKLIP